MRSPGRSIGRVDDDPPRSRRRRRGAEEGSREEHALRALLEGPLGDVTSLREHASALSAEEAASAWQRFVAGCGALAASADRDQTRLLLVRDARSTRSSLCDEDRRVLSLLLKGHSTKSMALELGLSTSTVWSRRESALEKLGVRSVAELSLLLPAPAPRDDADLEGPARAKALSCPAPFLALPVTAEGSALILFAVAIPPLEPPDELTDAERAVVRGVIEGRSNREIAAARATSPRTVANQLQSAFRKLRVSGRAELLHLCAERRVSSGG